MNVHIFRVKRLSRLNFSPLLFVVRAEGSEEARSKLVDALLTLNLTCEIEKELCIDWESCNNVALISV
jgi:hypothetical protein